MASRSKSAEFAPNYLSSSGRVWLWHRANVCSKLAPICRFGAKLGRSLPHPTQIAPNMAEPRPNFGRNRHPTEIGATNVSGLGTKAARVGEVRFGRVRLTLARDQQKLRGFLPNFAEYDHTWPRIGPICPDPTSPGFIPLKSGCQNWPGLLNLAGGFWPNGLSPKVDRNWSDMDWHLPSWPWR